uniref:Uncharacterized protein n=1 Tax=Ovis aries TaxID=9940 RepID=A0AC11CWQ7_SHEEP
MPGTRPGTRPATGGTPARRPARQPGPGSGRPGKPGCLEAGVDSEPPSGQGPEVNLHFGHRTWRRAPAGKRRTEVRCPGIAALLTLLLASSSLGQRARRPPRPPSPISTIQPKANFDAQQFAGTWLLVAVASPCRHLQEQGHRAEATTLHAVPQGSAMTVSTFRKLDGICWAVRQLYGDTGRPGRFLLQARGARGPVDVVVGDTDYRGFAVLYLEQARQLSVKLYVRSLPVGDSFLSAFEQRVQGANLTEDHTLFFPKYGFCEAADQFHTLDEVRR